MNQNIGYNQVYILLELPILLKYIQKLNILPCLKCKNNYSEVIIKYQEELDNLDSVTSCLNLVLSIHEDINYNKKNTIVFQMAIIHF